MTEIVPESATPGTDEPGGDLTCEVCGKALTYAGRGRKPRFCEDHKGGKQGTAATPLAVANGAPKRRTGKFNDIEKGLTQTLSMAGLALWTFEPYDAIVVLDRATDTAAALTDAAESNPRIAKALEGLIEASVWASLATAVASIAVPIMGHHLPLPIPQAAIETQFLSATAREQLAALPVKTASKVAPAPAPAPTQDSVTVTGLAG